VSLFWSPVTADDHAEIQKYRVERVGSVLGGVGTSQQLGYRWRHGARIQLELTCGVGFWLGLNAVPGCGNIYRGVSVLCSMLGLLMQSEEIRWWYWERSNKV